MSIQSRSAFVSGSTSGLGFSIALNLARRGFKVVIHGRDSEKLNYCLSEMKRSGLNVEAVCGDVSTPGVAEVLASRVIELAGGCVDILVNNVGGGGKHLDWWQTSTQKWRSIFELNVYSAAAFCTAMVPLMIDRNWGRVVFVSSTAAVRPLPIGPEYSAAKMALRTAAISLALACKGTGVTVNVVSPGLLSTDEHSCNGDYPTLINRLPNYQDVNRAIEYFISDDGAGVTANNIELDGGFRFVNSLIKAD
jgi:3-oxoacyl-[acyl-carrier protein] reductase